jgi:hydrogenase maturation factor
MNIAVWVSLATLLVGTIVTLSVAAMHRKQMRQIELHRADPSVSLVPPPHRLTLFLKTYGFIVAGGVLNLGLLIRQLRQTTPVTRDVVFDMILSTMGLVVMIFVGFAISLFDRAIKSAERTMDVLEGMSDKIHELSERGK